MAYINVAEWSPDQVTDWLKGLDDCMYYYIKSFTNNEVKGQQLLNIRPYELEQLGMQLIGHQEIVLEAVEHLRNFHYHLDKENLQFLALRVATTAQCLCNQLAHSCDKSKIETQILSDITRMIATIKPLISWLDRTPFQGNNQFYELRNNMLRIAIEMATSAQRDRFVENPVEQIKQSALRVAQLANYIIQDISDPMILQPAWLNLVTIKKKESELGFNIVPSYHGVHIVTDIKYNSPAHTTGKIEEGDEIVQINYQTVIGWQLKKVIDQLQESSPDILITLKKRPKHTKIYGQIYMKPYRLPSKKKSLPHRWGDAASASPRTRDFQHNNFPTPTPSLLPTIQQSNTQQQPQEQEKDVQTLPHVTEKHTSSDSDCSDILTPTPTTTQKSSDKDLRLYLPKPRAVLQRRNTICGDQVSDFKNNNVMFWHERFSRDTADDSPSLRDKSISFGFGLEIAPRPTTCLGIGSSAGGVGKFADFGGALKGSLPDIEIDKRKSNKSDVKEELSDKILADVCSKPGVSKVVRFDSNKDVYEYKDSKYSCNVENTILEVFEPIPYVDDEDLSNVTTIAVVTSDQQSPIKVSSIKPPVMKRMIPQQRAVVKNQCDLVEAVNDVLVKDQRFERSASVPAYNDASDQIVKDHSDDDADDDGSDDDSDDDFDIPPAIEPRIRKTPPAPPPRPRRSIDAPLPITFLSSITDSPKPETIAHQTESTPTAIKNTAIVSIHQPTITPPTPPPLTSTPTTSASKIPATRHFLEECELELLTPNKAKNLTLKKKNSIMAKRRNVTLKSLEMSDIQGHLYRRSKDKSGVTYWAKLYFVLADISLYGFKNKDSLKASFLIFLPGFTVSVAAEVHSKSFAFKVYHPTKTFYFAAESQQALTQWMDYIRQATIKGNPSLSSSKQQNIRELFSETESSDEEENEFGGIGGVKLFATPSPKVMTGKKGGSSANTSNDAATDSNTVTPPQKSDKYHLRFDSLKKFIGSSKTDKEKKATSSDVPVPTAQFRSYRKVPGVAGIQLGTNSMISSTGTAEFIPPMLSNKTTTTVSEIRSTSTPGEAMQLLLQSVPPPITTPFAPPAPNVTQQSTSQSTDSPPSSFGGFLKQQQQQHRHSHHHHAHAHQHHRAMIQPKSKKLRKTSPYNYIHASNPNLVEFDFPTSKTLDYSFPKVNPSNSWDAHHNLQGFVTLKDLMLQKQEEDAQEMYNNRVLLGVEKKSSGGAGNNNAATAGGSVSLTVIGETVEKPIKRKHRRAMAAAHLEPLSISKSGGGYGGEDRSAHNFNKIQSRSLPKTPDYAQSFKPDDSDIIMTRSREGQKLRDFGYEFISGDDPIDKSGSGHRAAAIAASAKGSTTDGSKSSSTRKKTAGLTWINSSTATDRKADGGGDDKSVSSRSSSFKKSKNKLVAETFESFKTSSERLFQFKYSGGSEQPTTVGNKSAEKCSGLKPTTSSFIPLTMPLNKKITTPSGGTTTGFTYGHVDGTTASSLKKSNTCNTPDFRDSTTIVQMRKNSAPERSASYFTKLTFSSNKSAKEKRLLGSPRLHRAIFGRRDSSDTTTSQSVIDHELFSPIEYKPRTSTTSAGTSELLQSDAASSSASSSITNISQQHLHQTHAQQNFNVHKLSLSTSAHTIGSPDYPNLEYPPVFEAETYSLSDVTSMTLLRRRNHNQSK